MDVVEIEIVNIFYLQDFLPYSTYSYKCYNNLLLKHDRSNTSWWSANSYRVKHKQNSSSVSIGNFKGAVAPLLKSKLWKISMKC